MTAGCRTPWTRTRLAQAIWAGGTTLLSRLHRIAFGCTSHMMCMIMNESALKSGVWCSHTFRLPHGVDQSLCFPFVLSKQDLDLDFAIRSSPVSKRLRRDCYCFSCPGRLTYTVPVEFEYKSTMVPYSLVFQ